MWSSYLNDDGNDQNSENSKTYGMTSAISTAYPKPLDLIRTQELEDTLATFDLDETIPELEHRMNVLGKLNATVKEWISEISLSRNNMAEEFGGKVYTFGSYRLGVHQKGADIDAICVAPRHIDRHDFFTSFYNKLKESALVTELRAVEEAFVPVLKMKFDGIEIDMLFARLALKEIPENMDLQDDMLLKNLDPKCVRSLNGCRVTDEILRLVPDVETFRLALRTIKIWAKNHGIYSNVLGYLGGVSWAMLVARTCQLYPNAVAATIVQKFFLVFSQWQWPKPVLLKQATKPNLNFPTWDPNINLADRAHLMPIITPAYPQQNSTFNVSLSSRTIIQKEFHVGFQLAEHIMMGKSKWEILFEKPNFFLRYRHFIVLIATTSTKKEHLEWFGLVESKIRHLVTVLERNKHINLVHANPEVFKQNPAPDERRSSSPDSSTHSDSSSSEQQPIISLWFVGIEFVEVDELNINLTGEIHNFIHAVMKHATAIKMYKDTMSIQAKYVKRRDLNQYIADSVIKRDRSLEEILEPIKQNNSATIMLQKNKTTITNGYTRVTTPNSVTIKRPLQDYQNYEGPRVAKRGRYSIVNNVQSYSKASVLAKNINNNNINNISREADAVEVIELDEPLPIVHKDHIIDTLIIDDNDEGLDVDVEPVSNYESLIDLTDDTSQDTEDDDLEFVSAFKIIPEERDDTIIMS